MLTNSYSDQLDMLASLSFAPLERSLLLVVPEKASTHIHTDKATTVTLAAHAPRVNLITLIRTDC